MQSISLLLFQDTMQEEGIYYELRRFSVYDWQYQRLALYPEIGEEKYFAFFTLCYFASFNLLLIFMIVSHFHDKDNWGCLVFGRGPSLFGASLVAWTVNRLPTMRETGVQSLGWKDPLEKEMATHSSTLTRKIPWMEKPGGLQSKGSQSVRHNWVTSLSFLSFLF